jgi:hypothetical protein
LVVGGALVLVGTWAGVRAVRRTADDQSTAGSGLFLAFAISLAFWGLVAVAIGLVRVLR